MNDLQIFNNPEFGEIRIIEIDGEPWFVGKDVAVALGYSNPRDALAVHVDSEDKATVAIHDGSQNRNMTIINESGVYSLIFTSKLPKAKEFKHWVTSEVLPSIRKTGAYLTPEAAAALADLPAIMELLSEMEERLSALENAGADTIRRSGIRPSPAGMDGEETVPGLAARKRWMRTMNEKLDLLSNRLGMTHNEILHSLYKILEKRSGVVLEEEKMRVMEEQDMTECSVLTAVFFTPQLRTGIERTIDYNLAPENRGW